MKYPKRQKIRLSRNLYQGPLVISVTLCFFNKIEAINAGFATIITETLQEVTVKYGLVSYSYCLMPDHLHWLLGLASNRYNVLDIIRYFKAKTSFKLKEKYSARQLWQDRFYDHILRKDEDINKQARYILENPLRKGLVTTITEHPYSGGVYFDELYQRP